jgi:hypothetical protein
LRSVDTRHTAAQYRDNKTHVLCRSRRSDLPSACEWGRQTGVMPERNWVPAAGEPERHTRCITIATPQDIITEAGFEAYFSQWFRLETDEVDFLVMGEVINVVEWRSVATAAWRNIREDAFHSLGSRGQGELWAGLLRLVGSRYKLLPWRWCYLCIDGSLGV